MTESRIKEWQIRGQVHFSTGAKTGSGSLIPCSEVNLAPFLRTLKAGVRVHFTRVNLASFGVVGTEQAPSHAALTVRREVSGWKAG
jgi:hypothetical protein